MLAKLVNMAHKNGWTFFTRFNGAVILKPSPNSTAANPLIDCFVYVESAGEVRKFTQRGRITNPEDLMMAIRVIKANRGKMFTVALPTPGLLSILRQVGVDTNILELGYYSGAF